MTGEAMSRSWGPRFRYRTDQRVKALGSRADRRTALGNAVVPQLAEYLGNLIISAVH
jgi:site-specific DNA-cytosine methylase